MLDPSKLTKEDEDLKKLDTIDEIESDSDDG